MEAPSGDDVEIEWQLDAQDLDVVLRWVERTAASADGLSLGPGKTLYLADTYLDTPAGHLERAGYSLRLRQARRGAAEATLKSLDGPRQDALVIRRELTEQVELDAGDPSGVALTHGPVGARVRALVGTTTLAPIFDLRTRRRVFPLTADGSPPAELVLDETRIRDPGGRVLGRLRRVELEAPRTAVDAVRPLVGDLRTACGLQPALLSKYESALAASGRRRSEPAGFGRTTIEPGDTIGQVGLAILRRQFAILLAKEPGTRLGDDAEELHDMRVASRRLRAAIALFGDSLPAEAERLRPELAWLGGTIGAVRDLDVQLEQVDAWSELLSAHDREPLARLRALLEVERAGSRRQMLEALDSPRYARLVRRFGAMLRSRTGTRTAPARAAAPDLVERRHRALRKAMRRIDEDADAAAYHRLRIACKRFRYALEFLYDVYPGETKRVVKDAVALQNLLGRHQDAHVAIERLRLLARERGTELGPETVFTMGELAERHHTEMHELRARVPHAYARLAGRAWKPVLRRLEAGRPPPAAPPPAPPRRPEA